MTCVRRPSTELCGGSPSPVLARRAAASSFRANASARAAAFHYRPNVLLIFLDDMGWSDFGCYGSEIRTPTIDRLAANGLRYRNFYNTARCSTSRCALQTGLYTQQAAVDPGASLPNLDTDNNLTIAEVLSTTGYRRYMAGKWHLGEGARSPVSRGYPHVFGLRAGGTAPFAEVSGGNIDSFWNPNNHGYYSTDGEIPALDFRGTRFHQTDAIGDYAVAFLQHHLDRQDGAPFFLYLPFNAVHWDINADNDLADRYTDVADLEPDGWTANDGADGGDFYQYEAGWDQVRADRFARQLALGVIGSNWVLSAASPAFTTNGEVTSPDQVVAIPAWDNLAPDRQADLARRMALYAAMLQQVDDNIRKVIDFLETCGQLDNTLVFILADNGGNYEGGVFGKTAGVINAPAVTGTENLRNLGQPASPDLQIGGGWANVNNTPFRLYKHYQHEGGIRTPLIVHWPAGIAAPGRWIEDRGHLIDILATIAEVTDTPYPAAWPGRNLLPLEGASLAPHFAPATEADFPDRPLGFEHEANRAWIDGRWKFVTKNFALLDGSSPAHHLELYDLEADPTELNNLAAREPEVLARMVAAWNAWAQRVGVPTDRLLLPPPPQFDPAPTGADLFVDTFNRGDTPDHDASAEGFWGTRVPPLAAGAAYYDAWEAGSTEIADLGLGMAVGAGMSETALRHNFVGQDILEAGGFSVQVRVLGIHSDPSDTANRYAGIAVGLSAAEAQAGDDINDETPGANSFRGTADFFLELDLDGNVKAWSNGTLLNTTPVGVTTGSLLAAFAVTSFNTGAPVTVSAFLDGVLVDLDSTSAATALTFPWEATDCNHIGLSARASRSVRLDNFAVRTLPVSTSLASEYALAAGLSGASAGGDADPDGDGDNNYLEWLRHADPTTPDPHGSLLWVAPNANGAFRFNYLRVLHAEMAGLDYVFRVSPRLGEPPESWPAFTPEPLEFLAMGHTHQLWLVQVPPSLTAGASHLFVHVQVGGR